MLVQPRYIALDTSHLAQWATSRTSPHAARRAAAHRFERWLEASAYLPLLCLHHIAELANHENEAVAAMRLRFIGSLPGIAWIGTQPEGSPGTLVTLFAEEVRAASEMTSPQFGTVRDRAKPRLIHAGTGAEMLGVAPEAWLMLRREFGAQAAHARQVVAFSRLGTVDIADKPMAELLKGRVREGSELRRQLDLMEGTFADHIRQRGDRRIDDPGAVAKGFMQDVEEMARGLPRGTATFIWGALARQGVTVDDLTPTSTVGDMLDLGLFRTQLKIACEAAGIPAATVIQTIRPDCLPSWTVTRAVERHLPDVPKREGGELNDTALVFARASIAVSERNDP